MNSAELGELFSVIHAHGHMDDCLNATAEKTCAFFRADAVEIHIADELSRTLLLKAHRGLSSRFVGSGMVLHGEGLSGRVTESRKAVLNVTLTDEQDEDTQPARKEGFSSYAGVPIVANGAQVGVLGLYYKTPREFAKEENTLFLEIGKQLGLAVHNLRSYEQSVQKAQRLVAISRAMTVTRQLGTLDRVLDDIAKMLVRSLGFDLSWIGLVSGEGTVLEGRTGFGAGMKRQAVSMHFPVQADSDNPAIRALRERRSTAFTLMEDLQESPLKKWLVALNVQNGGFVSIQSGDKTIGVIGCFYTSDRLYVEEDARMLISVSEQASIAIENAKLYEQSKTSEERYRTLFESTGTSMAIVDPHGRFKLVNRAFEDLGGFPAHELIGKKSITQFILKMGAVSAEKKILFSQKWEDEFVDRKRDLKHVVAITAPIPHSEDVLVSLVDMTREQELEKRLHESQELASLGELSAGIAHEIRNPLIAINTSVSILKDERELSLEGQQVLDVVKEETDHLAAIVNDFLKYARPKKLVLEKEDLNKLVRDALKRFKDQCGEKLVWIERYDETLPPISMDRHQLQQVITNLLSNSVDAMPTGGKVFIETSTSGGKKENRILIVIKDTGSGIQADLLTKIFQPFFSTKEKGTGMGLAICRRIVNQHCGEMYVESEPGKGAVFTVALPVETQPSEPSE